MCKLPLIYIPVQNYTTENHKKTVKVLSDAKSKNNLDANNLDRNNLDPDTA